MAAFWRPEIGSRNTPAFLTELRYDLEWMVAFPIRSLLPRSHLEEMAERQDRPKRRTTADLPVARSEFLHVPYGFHDQNAARPACSNPTEVVDRRWITLSTVDMKPDLDMIPWTPKIRR